MFKFVTAKWEKDGLDIARWPLRRPVESHPNRFRDIWKKESGDVNNSACTFIQPKIPVKIPQLSAVKVGVGGGGQSWPSLPLRARLRQLGEEHPEPTSRYCPLIRFQLSFYFALLFAVVVVVVDLESPCPAWPSTWTLSFTLYLY